MKKKQNFEEEKTPQRKTSKERNRTEKKKCSKTLGEITTLLLLVDELKRLRNGNENCKKIETKKTNTYPSWMLERAKLIQYYTGEKKRHRRRKKIQSNGSSV